MKPIVRVGHELFIRSTPESMISFNGTGYAHTDGEVVGEVGCLADWQRDPGAAVRGGHYVLTHLTNKAGESFLVGGSWLFVTAFAEENDLEVALHTARMFDDRNVVRSLAEQSAGTAW